MNVALHGLEEHLGKSCSHRNKPGVIRFADDFVVIHEDLDILKALQEQAEIWLAGMGLRLKPSKTHIRHTLYEHEGPAGFDFLGFTVRQLPAAKYRTRTYRGKPGFKTIIRPSEKAQKRHLLKLKDKIRSHRGNSQAALVSALNPVIRGWANYYRTCSAATTFGLMDYHSVREAIPLGCFSTPQQKLRLALSAVLATGEGHYRLLRWNEHPGQLYQHQGVSAYQGQRREKSLRW